MAKYNKHDFPELEGDEKFYAQGLTNLEEMREAYKGKTIVFDCRNHEEVLAFKLISANINFFGVKKLVALYHNHAFDTIGLLPQFAETMKRKVYYKIEVLPADEYDYNEKHYPLGGEAIDDLFFKK